MRMSDGRHLNGEILSIAKVDEKIEDDGEARVKSIVVIDNGLWRVYVPRKQVVATTPNAELFETFKIRNQRFASGENANRYESIGDCAPLEPFDSFGRRLVVLAGPKGPEYEIQAITEITTRYVRARGIDKVWDARYALFTIPRSVLSPILNRQIDPRQFDDRIRLFHFYSIAKYYEAAEEELQSIREDFKDDPNITEKVQRALRDIKRFADERLENELKMRSEAGQHRQVAQLLRNFNTEGVSSIVLQSIRRMLEKYEGFEQKRDALLLRMQQLADAVKDEKVRAKVEDVLDEIEAEVNPNTFDRLSAFVLNETDDSLSNDEKLAIGLSGWLIGSQADNRRLVVAVSLAETRRLVREYLLEADKSQREKIFQAIRAEEAGTPEFVAAILKLMKPPDVVPEGNPEKPGYYDLEIKGIEGAPFYEMLRYAIQLPPEYDPNRPYPTIVSLHSAGATPEDQLRFWAGPWSGPQRLGQASRHGFLVIAPTWGIPGQRSYDQSPLAHGAVLKIVQDACSRFNIDTDRIFLSGHGIGADAAWDIGLAHPDLWAGLIPFCGQASKTVDSYSENAKYLPFYFVGGELDASASSGTYQNKLITNGKSFNYYLRGGFDATVALYLGRGAELYAEEQFALFDWMKPRRRTVPSEFAAKLVRPLNDFYFFWNLELPVVPDETSWPKTKGELKPLEVKSEYLEKLNKLKISASKGISPQLYLTPEMINFKDKVDIEVNGRKFQPKSGYLEPDLLVMLEDVRTRKDRRHPFWVRLDADSRQ